jgi:GNAT superfamily N-acetyltransferase
VAGADARLEPDLAMGSLGVPIPPLNVISGARLDEKDVDARIDRALAWFADRGMPVSWWIGPHDRPRDLGEYLARHGLVRIEAGIPGMATDLNRLPDETPPPDLGVERVDSPQAFRDACEVIAAGFGAPMEVAEAMARFAETAIGEDVAQRVFLVRAGGRAVGTALGVAEGPILGIFNVATVPDARRRGVGRAVTLATLRDGAARGCRLAVLQSTEMGHAVYERLGFRDFGSYELWSHPTEPATGG